MVAGREFKVEGRRLPPERVPCFFILELQPRLAAARVVARAVEAPQLADRLVKPAVAARGAPRGGRGFARPRCRPTGRRRSPPGRRTWPLGARQSRGAPARRVATRAQGAGRATRRLTARRASRPR